MQKTDIVHEEVAQHALLTPEELIIEKKLRRRIDCLIFLWRFWCIC